ncbi:MAG: carboxypeptidase-like regulatory domain-containing protein [Armatimonadetes bacterium]|nr:carboxypeptidase-like regulatory domain-containing protein [Armatimonadota bacterium]
MMRWVTTLMLLLGTLMMFGCNNNGNGLITGIFGQVINKGTRQPIANATVSLQQNGREIASANTDSSGKFAFPNLSPGTYMLVVSANGYLNAQVQLTLAQKQRLSFTVEMVLSQEGPPTDLPITD